MESAVADTPITERQKFWRDHVLAAATFDGTIVEYAEANNLKTKDIYQWKTSLTKRGLLDRGEKKSSDDFVVVAPVATKQKKSEEFLSLRLTLGSVAGGIEATCFAEDDITRNYGIANMEIEGMFGSALEYVVLCPFREACTTNQRAWTTRLLIRLPAGNSKVAISSEPLSPAVGFAVSH